MVDVEEEQAAQTEQPTEISPREEVDDAEENTSAQELAPEEASNSAEAGEPADEPAGQAQAEQPEPIPPVDVAQAAAQEDEEEPSPLAEEQQTVTPEIQDKEEDDDDDDLGADERLAAEKKEVFASKAPATSEADFAELGFLPQIRAAIVQLGGIGELIEVHEEALKRMRDRGAKLTLLSKRLSALVESNSAPSAPSHRGGSPSAGAQPLPRVHGLRRATLLAKADEQARLTLRATTRQTLQMQSLRLHEPPQSKKTPRPPKRVEP
ncbi:hypothetical protein Esti_002905 [Eimeria stiedai]